MPCDVCPNQSELEKIFAFNYQYCEIWKQQERGCQNCIKRLLLVNKEENSATVKNNFNLK